MNDNDIASKLNVQGSYLYFIRIQLNNSFKYSYSAE